MIELTSLPEVEAALEASMTRPIFVLKHSTRCPISAGAYQRVLHYIETAGETAPPAYLVKVIESRPVSNDLATRLNIQHQSPQLILVKNKTAAWHASHNAITAQAIQAALSHQ
ncbi:MAG TPA: bacillithiol system redox-active protein YtxJ [Candidatus Hydrogenedentes bacterium]|mgnify:CR=1 FL=1|nr:bacillithiol system redox-active protein YtxJ [Candidatus Hydrogenedentota bacterium]